MDGHRSYALALVWAVALMLASSPSIAGPGEQAWSPPALPDDAGDLPEAREVVQRAIDFMQTHDRLRFEVQSTYEVVQASGLKLQFEMLQRVAIRRPDRIYWVTLSDDATTETAWCYDGKFTMLKEPANIWGRVNVPASLSAAVARVAYEYNVTVPFVDLLSGDAMELWLGAEVKSVDYIGEAWAEGQWTDHVALRRPGIDVQLWFRKGDEPFPAKIAIVHTDDEGLPGFTARFHQWSTVIPDGSIPEFVPPEGSERLEIAPVVERADRGSR